MFVEFCHAGRIDFQSNPHISPVCLPDVFQVLDTKPNKAEIQSLVHSDKQPFPSFKGLQRGALLGERVG